MKLITNYREPIETKNNNLPKEMSGNNLKNWNRFTIDPNAEAEQYVIFTNKYQSLSSGPKTIREIECLRIQYPIQFFNIEPGDLFAGRESKPAIGFAPQSSSFGYYMDAIRMQTLLQNPELSSNNRTLVEQLIAFWSRESSEVKTRDAYPEKMKEVLFSDDWQNSPVIAAPLYRMSGMQCDFDKLIRLGIPGLKNEVALHKINTVPDSESFSLYEGMEKALDLFCEICFWYSDMARSIVNTEILIDQKDELERISTVLVNIVRDKPCTVREAIQLMILYAGVCGTQNYGRMDEYLGDLYAEELKNGSLNEEEAIVLLSNLWALMDSKGYIWDSRIIVGGRGRRNEINADRFALVAIETTKRVRSIVPQFTLRFHKDQDPSLYEKALDSIATGNPYPMIYNDEVNIPAVQNAFNLPYEEAINYLPFGCGEYSIYHRGAGTPSGVINLLQALSVTLHGGINPVSGKAIGVESANGSNNETFNDLFNAYKKNVELYVEQLALQEKLEYEQAGVNSPYLFLSLLFDDCIKNGKSIFDGGVRYLGGTLETYGNTNTADSLAAIKKLVYEERAFTLDHLVFMLDANFEGFEKEQKMMLEVPKYGNDDDYADIIKVEVDRHVCKYARDMAVKSGLHSYLVVIINNSANTTMGKQTAASPDGRKAFTYMANGNSPTGGADKNGVTAFLNSILKPDTTIHAGAVQNMKFSKEMFSTYRNQTEALLKTYFDKGGAQCMINCIGKEDLENAMKHPEQYANLIVRVGGFSARFVELPKEVQQEILSRTMY